MSTRDLINRLRQFKQHIHEFRELIRTELDSSTKPAMRVTTEDQNGEPGESTETHSSISLSPEYRSSNHFKKKYFDSSDSDDIIPKKRTTASRVYMYSSDDEPKRERKSYSKVSKSKFGSSSEEDIPKRRTKKHIYWDSSDDDKYYSKSSQKPKRVKLSSDSFSEDFPRKSHSSKAMSKTELKIEALRKKFGIFDSSDSDSDVIEKSNNEIISFEKKHSTEHVSSSASTNSVKQIPSDDKSSESESESVSSDSDDIPPFVAPEPDKIELVKSPLQIPLTDSSDQEMPKEQKENTEEDYETDTILDCVSPRIVRKKTDDEPIFFPKRLSSSNSSDIATPRHNAMQQPNTPTIAEFTDSDSEQVMLKLDTVTIDEEEVKKEEIGDMLSDSDDEKQVTDKKSSSSDDKEQESKPAADVPVPEQDEEEIEVEEEEDNVSISSNSERVKSIAAKFGFSLDNSDLIDFDLDNMDDADEVDVDDINSDDDVI